jgi:hypothetical protein
VSEPSESSRLVAQVKLSLDNLDAPMLAKALSELVTVEPIQWCQLLLLAGLFPEPSPQKVKEKAGLLPKTLSCLIKAMQQLLDSDVDHLETTRHIVLTLQGFLLLQGYYGDIIDELNKLAFVKSPPEVQIHRLLALAESQHRTIGKKVNKIHEKARVIDPMAGYVSNVPSKFDDSKISVGEAFDTVCENIELGLRFILHSNKLSAKPTLQANNGPYRDVEIEKFCNLAGLWRIVAEQWANMRFRDWRWTMFQKQSCCVPADRDAYLREHAGALRYQLFMQDRIIARLLAPENRPVYPDALRSVAASIIVPAAGAPWDAKIDLDALKELCSLAPLQIFIEEYVHHRHYAPLIDDVSVGTIGWREWVTGKTVLYCLADAVSQAVTDQVPEDDLACMRQVVVVPEASIAEILVVCGGLTERQSHDLLSVFRFDPKRKSLEVWDQPLIPCGSGLVFLVPCLAKTGSPARALENFVTQWGGVSFDVRGIPFEKYLVREVHERSVARAVSGITIERAGEKDLEFDVVVWWEGYLLLLEAKCEKAVFSAADYWRAKRQIKKSIDQLILRRSALTSVWSELRTKAPKLDLPETYVGDDRILCVSITNIMDFTGYTRDGVVVTDDSCFFRFFDDRMVKKYYLGGSKVEEVEAIRASEVPHPSELIAYLANPPQMRRLLDKMKAGLRVIPAITERSPGFRTAHIEFIGEEDAIDGTPGNSVQ